LLVARKGALDENLGQNGKKHAWQGEKKVKWVEEHGRVGG
jgi:hypothetical protein